MKRTAGAAMVIVGSLTVLGCGSEGSREESQLLPRDLGADLVGRTEKVRATLENGKGCAAQRQARQLRVAVSRSIDQGRVPAELQGELRRRARGLADSIVCVPPPPPPPPQTDEDDDHKGRGKGHGKGRGKGDD